MSATDDLTPVAPVQPATPVKLRRNLTIWQALGLSVGSVGLSLSANINPQGAVSVVGRAIPLGFAIATAGILLVCYGFIRLAQYYQHSGSVFAFVGATFGPQAGVVAGWALLGSYLCFGVASGIAGGMFGTDLLHALSIWPNPPQWAPYLLSIVLLVIGGTIALTPARGGTDLLLIFEGITVALILIVAVIVLVRVISGSVPGDQHFTMSVFAPPSNTGASSIFLGAVFGFLGFGGFEAAASLGEETNNGRRDIPRALLGTAIIAGCFFIFTSMVEVLGFGTSKADLARFQASGSLLGDLGRTYIAGWVGDIVTFGTMISAFAGALALGVGASRLIYSLSRSAHVPGLRVVSRKWGTPFGATLATFCIMLVVTVVFGWIIKDPALTEFSEMGSVGTYVLLIAYALTTLAAIRLILRKGALNVPRWQLVVPVAAVAVLGYTLYRNVVPYPTGSAAWLPVAAGLWLLVALVTVLCLPRVAKRIGVHLTADEGIDPGVEAVAD